MHPVFRLASAGYFSLADAETLDPIIMVHALSNEDIQTDVELEQRYYQQLREPYDG